jgi:hypothetical protein
LATECCGGETKNAIMAEMMTVGYEDMADLMDGGNRPT